MLEDSNSVVQSSLRHFGEAAQNDEFAQLSLRHSNAQQETATKSNVNEKRLQVTQSSEANSEEVELCASLQRAGIDALFVKKHLQQGFFSSKNMSFAATAFEFGST